MLNGKMIILQIRFSLVCMALVLLDCISLSKAKNNAKLSRRCSKEVLENTGEKADSQHSKTTINVFAEHPCILEDITSQFDTDSLRGPPRGKRDGVIGNIS